MGPEFIRELSPDQFSAITPTAIRMLPPHIIAVSALGFSVNLTQRLICYHWLHLNPWI